MSEKTEGSITNEQSSYMDNIGYTRHRTEIDKTKNTTQKTKHMSNTDPTISMCSLRVRSYCLLLKSAMLMLMLMLILCNHYLTPCFVLLFSQSPNCMLVTSSQSHIDIYPYLSPPIGQEFDIDRQCQMIFGPSSYANRV